MIWNHRVAPIWALLFAVALGNWHCSEQAGDGSGPPRLEIVGGDTVNWGTVGAAELTRSLKLVNAGGDTLHIADVKPSCGCTTAPLDKKALGSGDTAVIDITMDVKGRSGKTTKTIRIMTNDSSQPNRVVSLRADVIQELKASPNYLAVGNAQPGVASETSTVIHNMAEKPITIQPPKEQSALLMDVKFNMDAPVTVGPGDSVVVSAKVTPLNATPQTVKFDFETDSDVTPTLTIPMTLSVVQGGNPGQ